MYIRIGEDGLKIDRFGPEAHARVFKAHPELKNNGFFSMSRLKKKELLERYLIDDARDLKNKATQAKILQELKAKAAAEKTADAAVVNKLSKNDERLKQKYTTSTTLQANLYKLGYLKGNRASVVDGRIGSGTYAAIKAALKAGYNVDMNTGAVTEIKGFSGLSLLQRKEYATANEEQKKALLQQGEKLDAEYAKLCSMPTPRKKLVEPWVGNLKNFNPLSLATNAITNTVGEVVGGLASATLGNTGRFIHNLFVNDKDRWEYKTGFENFSKNIAEQTNRDMERGRGIDPFTFARNANEGNYWQMAANGVELVTDVFGAGSGTITGTLIGTGTGMVTDMGADYIYDKLLDLKKTEDLNKMKLTNPFEYREQMKNKYRDLFMQEDGITREEWDSNFGDNYTEDNFFNELEKNGAINLSI